VGTGKKKKEPMTWTWDNTRDLGERKKDSSREVRGFVSRKKSRRVKKGEKNKRSMGTKETRTQ